MSIDKLTKIIVDELKKEFLGEATGSSGVGSIRAPLSPGMRLWDKKVLQPFEKKISNYDSAELAYDSYDGKMSTPKKKRKNIEQNARRIEKFIKKHPLQSDNDGDILNGKQGKTKNTPPFTVKINEDLAVWFGTKKKPKGSKQPKGPWVNICRREKDGGHPPCGRPEAKDRGYPKCRAAGVASKMTDSQKRSACQQKRRAEKSHSKSGTGNSPKMTSYKTKKESSKIKKIIRDYISNNTI